LSLPNFSLHDAARLEAERVSAQLGPEVQQFELLAGEPVTLEFHGPADFCSIQKGLIPPEIRGSGRVYQQAQGLISDNYIDRQRQLH
jgi:hypothetical protein